MSGLTSDLLIQQFKSEHCSFYFSNDSLGISSEIAHAAGDHLEFEIKYKNLKDSIIGDNAFWNEILEEDSTNNRNANLYAVGDAFNEQYPMVYTGELTTDKVLDGLSQVLGYAIKTNSVKFTSDRIDVDLK